MCEIPWATQRNEKNEANWPFPGKFRFLLWI